MNHVCECGRPIEIAMRVHDPDERIELCAECCDFVFDVIEDIAALDVLGGWAAI